MPSRLRLALPHLVMLVVAALLYAIASRIEGSTASAGRIGPDFWPKVVIGFMGLLAAFEVVKRLWFGAVDGADGPADAGAAPGADAAADGGGEPMRRAMLFGGGALVVGYVLAVERLGFFLSTVLFLWGFAHVGGFRRIGWNLAIAVAGSLLTLVLFMRVAYISLPLGEGPFRALSLALLRLIGVS